MRSSDDAVLDDGAGARMRWVMIKVCMYVCVGSGIVLKRMREVH